MAKRILIAEDNDKIAGLMTGLLKRYGYECDHVADGVSALQKIATSLPDALVLDLKLPRLHGIELLKKLRASSKTAHLPVMIVSGVYRGEQYVNSAKKMGVDVYLEKPFGASQFINAVQKTLSTATSAEETKGEQPLASSPLPFSTHLIKAYRERFSGTCKLTTADGAIRNLVFADGAPVSLRPGFRHKNFGDYLLKKGSITESEYKHYATRGKFRYQVFVRMGCLPYIDLLQEKLRYLTDELIIAFTAPVMVATRFPVPWPEQATMISVNTPQILLGGYRQMYSGQTLPDLVRQMSGYPRFTEEYYQTINFFSLAGEEQRFLARVTGERTLGDCLADISPIDPFLQLMIDLGMVGFSPSPQKNDQPTLPVRAFFNAYEEEVEEEIAPEELVTFDDFLDDDDIAIPEAPPEPAPVPAAPAKPATASAPSGATQEDDIATQVRKTYEHIKGKNHYEIFDIPLEKFSFERLKEAYFAVTRKFGPEVMMQLYGEESEMVQEILSAVTTAYNTLSDVVKKERYDEMLGSDKIGLGRSGDDRFQAKVQFESGKAFLGMEEWDSAEKALKDACHIDSENGEYQAHLAWAIYKNPKYANSRATIDKARKDLNRALTLTKSAAGFAFKGWMLIDSGQEGLAEAEFNKAIRIDPKQMMARKGLRTIQEKQEEAKKGLFRRMFG